MIDAKTRDRLATEITDLARQARAIKVAGYSERQHQQLVTARNFLRAIIKEHKQ